MNFHSNNNYTVLVDIVKDIFPVDTSDNIKKEFDAKFNNFRPSSTDLVSANKEFLKNVISHLSALPRKISINDFTNSSDLNYDVLNYDILKCELDDPTPPKVVFEDNLKVETAIPLTQLVDDVILTRQYDTADVQTKRVHFEKQPQQPQSIYEKLLTIRQSIDEVLAQLPKH